MLFFIFARFVFIFSVVFVFGLVSYVAWKKFLRPLLFKEKLDGKIVSATERFQSDLTDELADDIVNGGLEDAE